VKTLTSRLKRPAVLLLIAAGWLSILGNSPGPTATKKLGARSGAVVISLADQMWGSGCSSQGSLSMPVRRVALLSGSQLLYEAVCADGTDCFRSLSIPIDNNRCRQPTPDGGRDSPPVEDTGSDAVASDAQGDVGAASDAKDAVSSDAPGSDAPGSSDAPTSDGPASSDALVSADAISPDATAGDAPAGYGLLAATTTPSAAVSALQSRATDAGDPGRLVICDGLAAHPVAIRYDESSRFRYHDTCWNEKATYKILVETASGAQGTLEYRIEVEEPDGYFGC
jgi:hypothetical protein